MRPTHSRPKNVVRTRAQGAAHTDHAAALCTATSQMRNKWQCSGLQAKIRTGWKRGRELQHFFNVVAKLWGVAMVARQHIRTATCSLSRDSSFNSSLRSSSQLALACLVPEVFCYHMPSFLTLRNKRCHCNMPTRHNSWRISLIMRIVLYSRPLSKTDSLTSISSSCSSRNSSTSSSSTSSTSSWQQTTSRSRWTCRQRLRSLHQCPHLARSRL
mmetsp:Transcript_41910/g.104181  ORF Transcript_41910/g.104181 Transcript_41910/m.104181 type:complete len:214 (+) Transcript_41910:235-876(+)